MSWSQSLTVYTTVCGLAFSSAVSGHGADYAVWQWAAFAALFFCVWVLPSWGLYQIAKFVFRNAFGEPSPVEPKRRKRIEPHLAGFATVDAQPSN